MVEDPNFNDTHHYSWWVPISYTTSKNPNFEDAKATHWISPNDKQISIQGNFDKENWVIFNVMQTGYYRVNYDLNNWKHITRQLLKNFANIHMNNRAQLLDDALNLARAGKSASN